VKYNELTKDELKLFDSYMQLLKVSQPSFHDIVSRLTGYCDTKIFIFGTGGLSHYIQKECEKRKISYYVIPRIELYSEEGTIIFDENKRNVCINTIGWGDVQGCENDKIKSLESNALSVYHVMRKCCGHDLIHISTNDVFGNYPSSELSFDTKVEPKPTSNTYCQHKYLAENILTTTYDQDKLTIIRGTFMSPWSQSKGGYTFYYKALQKIRNNEEVNGYTNQLTCPVSVDTYARAIVDVALDVSAKNTRSNVFKHIASNKCSRYSLLCDMARKITGNTQKIKGSLYGGNGPVNAVLSPAAYNLSEEVDKFIKLCNGVSGFDV